MRDKPIFIFFLLIVCLVLFWGVFYPNLSVLLTSFQQKNTWSLANYKEIFISPLILRATFNSFWISIATVIGSAIVGGAMALIFHFLEFPGRRIFAALAPLPLLMPPLIGVIAFIFLYGESGIISRAIIKTFSLTSPAWQLNGPGAILAVHIYSFYAYFYTFISTSLNNLDYSLLDAARSLGASRQKIFFSILLPLLKPALIGASLLTFMNSMASFSAPYLFGGGTPMLTLQIFNAKVGSQWELAMAESVLLAILSIFALIWLTYNQETTIGGSKGTASITRRTITNFWLKLTTLFVTFIAITIIILPLLTLLLISFAKDGSWTVEILPPSYTFSNYEKVFSNPRFIEPIYNSLIMSALSAAGAFFFSLPAAYLFTRTKFFGQKALIILTMIPWALPGTVLGLSFAASFNEAKWSNGGIVLIGTFWILPILYFLRTLPLVLRSTQANLEQVDANLEGASRSLGASFFYTLRHVILPLILPGAISGTALAFATAMGEFVTSVIVYVPNSRPISIEIAAQLRAFHLGNAAVYGVFLTIIIAISLLIGRRLSSTKLSNNI
ncbi:MAG: iron ABC transporter permease [Acidobacteria bacterium]|nr:iron ABC transporter permease [Acidobacteriota bacterium]